MKVEWTPEYSVGNEELDGQHQRWIGMINALHDLLMTGRAGNSIILDQLLAMRDYGRDHFQYEEEYMARIGYPHLEAHRREHQAFMSRMENTIAEEQAGHHLLPSEVMSVMMAWLRSHILERDMAYARYRAEQE